MKAIEAARKFASEANKQSGTKYATVWNKKKCKEMGYCPNANAAVCIESTGLEVFDIRPVGSQPYENVFCEPYSAWLMAFYQEKETT